MLPSATALSTQQLAEFLAAVSAVPDARSAMRVAAERAARALEAEVSALLRDGAADDAVVSSVGFPIGRVPVRQLTEVAAGRRWLIDVPGAGLCHTAVTPLRGRTAGHLVVARSGADGFTVDEVSLLRGIARVLDLTVENLHRTEAERQQAAENERLLSSLRERNRLLEQLSRIQRSISRREALADTLDAITAGAKELFADDEVVGLRMRDPDDPQMLLLVSQTGVPEHLAKELWRASVHDAGAPGQAVLRDELVVFPRYATSPHNIPELADSVQAAMAAPVHDAGEVAGALVVASFRPRVYTTGDQEMLQVFAEHVSLAVTDHHTRQKMHEAYHDSLTGLASRALFMERLEQSLARASRQRTRLAVLFVDLDRFKMVNDSLGHAAGDTLLIGVAERLRSCLRRDDAAARFGGDEFAVVLPELDDPGQAVGTAERINAVLRQPFTIQGTEVFVNASVGIAYNGDDVASAEELMRHADLAMYRSKKNGAGQHEIYRHDMQAALVRTLDLEAQLRRAVERDDFVLHYQPIVELASGRITGVEALVRWRHRQHGVIAPATFVPLAEETGLIVPIGRWVLGEACRQAGAWNAGRAGQPLTVSVNLSARQVQQPDLPGVVGRTLLETGLDPSCLVLEITESLLLLDTEAITRRLHQLKELGLRLALDDFGTGYSSLAYLRKFPIDIIKIDKSFIDEITRGPDDSALALAIVQLGQQLRLSTVAEGIEAVGQLAELRAAGCPLGQGYFFSAPLAAEDVDTLLAAGAAVPDLLVHP
ncbi:putative bifunctional diguanylate cyclase/phosphodiesterase [Planosporangium sp. 12N6]|uniref:putative bifunctional diguanylate cyclase/phosphodiesterase n=1 Tax=Planosporangium spinosum TaxID=3402278 RepID=UPI003CE6A236